MADEADVSEIQVIDNASDDDLRGISDGRVRVHRPGRNLGFGRGQNLGRALTSAPLVLMLNPDAVMRPGALAAGIQALRGDPSLAAVQGVCRRADGMPERSQGRELGPLHLLARATNFGALLRYRAGRRLASAFRWSEDHAARVPEHATDVDWLAATALLVRRAAIEQVDGFDERYFLYGEDLDLCRRLRTAGWRLSALTVEWAGHQGGGSFALHREREVEWWRGTLLFAAIWWDTIGWWTAVMAAAVRALTLAPSSLPQDVKAFLVLISEARAERMRRSLLSEGRASEDNGRRDSHLERRGAGARRRGLGIGKCRGDKRPGPG